METHGTLLTALEKLTDRTLTFAQVLCRGEQGVLGMLRKGARRDQVEIESLLSGYDAGSGGLETNAGRSQ